MTLFKLVEDQLTPLEGTTLQRERVRERDHLQTALMDRIEAVVPNGMVLAEEAGLFQDNGHRVDLLCVDPDGTLVIVELKRDETAGHADLQAVRYAAMASSMSFDDACDWHERHRRKVGLEGDRAEAERVLVHFLEDDTPHETFGNAVRIVLVSCDFSKELTTSVLWLTEQGVDISCVRMSTYKHDGDCLIDFQRFLPPPLTDEYRVRMVAKRSASRVASQSRRDHTKYLYDGVVHHKNRLALRLIQEWAAANEPADLDAIRAAWVVPSHGYVVASLEHAEDLERRKGRRRYFSAEGERITTASGQIVCVNSGWTLDQTEELIQLARGFGYAVQALPESAS